MSRKLVKKIEEGAEQLEEEVQEEVNNTDDVQVDQEQ